MASRTSAAKKRTPKHAHAWFPDTLAARYKTLIKRYKVFLDRRPHRSFRRTSRRAMPITAPVPGFVSLTKQTLHTIKRSKRPYVYFALIFIIFNLLVIGLTQQQTYQAANDSIKNASELSSGSMDEFSKNVSLLGLAISGGFNGDLSESQQALLALTTIITWLAIIWYLRNRLADNTVNVRDAIYNAGAPIVPMLVLSFIALIQLLPVGLGLLAFVVARSAGIDGGVEQMMFAIAVVLLFILSLYWLASTIFATFIITIPGTYPIKALKLAGDIVIGRRLKVLLRLLAVIVTILVVWVIVLIPTFLLAGQIRVTWLPLLPLVLQILSVSSLLFFVTYMYLFYRRMLDEPSR